MCILLAEIFFLLPQQTPPDSLNERLKPTPIQPKEFKLFLEKITKPPHFFKLTFPTESICLIRTYLSIRFENLNAPPLHSLVLDCRSRFQEESSFLVWGKVWKSLGFQVPMADTLIGRNCRGRSHCSLKGRGFFEGLELMVFPEHIY